MTGMKPACATSEEQLMVLWAPWGSSGTGREWLMPGHPEACWPRVGEATRTHRHHRRGGDGWGPWSGSASDLRHEGIRT